MNLDLPDDVDGASGELNIADKFCKVYEELYNSSGSSEAMEVLKTQISLNVGTEESLAEVFKINGKIVKAAACKMKHGKCDVSEAYTSDAILNAPDILFDQLAIV